MSSRKEIIYNIKNIIASGRISDDQSVSYRQIGFIFDYKRAQYLRQDQKKNWFDMDTIYQDLGILEMEQVDSSECDCFPTGCTIYRTKKLIPEMIRFSLKYGVKVNAINRTKRFELVLPERFEFTGYTKFGRLTIPIYFLNNRFYTKDLAAMNVRAVLASPDDAKGFDCNGTECFNDDMEYPLPADMITLITADILNTELKVLLSLAQDLENNATDKNERTN